MKVITMYICENPKCEADPWRKKESIWSCPGCENDVCWICAGWVKIADSDKVYCSDCSEITDNPKKWKKGKRK